MKKIYVKIFLEDGNTRGMLIDERWTVLETMKHLAEKLKIPLTPEHVILEEYPDLHFSEYYDYLLILSLFFLSPISFGPFCCLFLMRNILNKKGWLFRINYPFFAKIGLQVHLLNYEVAFSH